MADKKKWNGKSFAWGALAGGIIGGVTALLLAPKSGKELRADIKEQAQAVGDKAHTAVKTVGSRTSEAFGKVKEVAGTIGGEIRGGWKNARKEADVVEIAKQEEDAAG